MSTTSTYRPSHGGYPGRVQADCPRCRGYGEVAVSGTYGPFVGPENLEFAECPACGGSGVVTLS